MNFLKSSSVQTCGSMITPLMYRRTSSNATRLDGFTIASVTELFAYAIGNDFVKHAQRLRQQSDDLRVEFSFEEIDVLDADLLRGIFQAFGQDVGQAKRNFGMMGHQIPEIRSRQHEDDSRLHRHDGADRGFPVSSDISPTAAPSESWATRKSMPVDGSFLRTSTRPGFDDVHRNAGSAFANDDLGRRKLRGLQTGPSFARLSGTEFGEKLDLLQELDDFTSLIRNCRHLSLRLARSTR